LTGINLLISIELILVNVIRSAAMRTDDAPALARRLLAELLGSAFLAALVVGSGIAAQTLSPNDLGLQLFENAAATAAGLYTIILSPTSRRR
jgi:hypothetical protein